ncbi:MAG TPA: acyloxyacyl hydrolase [Pyrinomonadaceae bacterium]|nr:acyloxyacyl hydrolase [Pyrinomonadaceae bacterium]
MKLFVQFVSAIALAVCLSPSVFAQVDDNPFTLKRGDNEFGFWGGVSPAATTIFGGLRDDEAEDRKFVIAAFRYGRTLAANDSLALQYTLDAVPLALATGTIVSRATVGGVTTFQRETAYGGGVTPLGLQLDFANGSKVHPFAHVNGGLLWFNKSVPIEDAGKLALVGEAGGGVRIFTSERRAVSIGVRFHHISNGDRAGSNRGLNQFVIYAGFSIFR